MRAGVWKAAIVSARNRPGFSIADPSRTRSVGVEKRATARDTGVLGSTPGPVRDAVEFVGLSGNGALHVEGLEYLAGHETRKWLPGRSLYYRADENPAPDGVAVLRARFEQERFSGEHRHRLTEACTVVGGHGVVVVAADAVDAGDIAHQLARGDRPLFRGVCRDIPLNGRVEIEAPPIVQKGGGNRRQRFREGAETETRARRDGRPAVVVGPAEPFGPDDLAIDGDGHREARQVVTDHQCSREPPRILYRTRVPVGGRGRRR